LAVVSLHGFWKTGREETMHQKQKTVRQSLAQVAGKEEQEI
jgi:hypothetical protein